MLAGCVQMSPCRICGASVNKIQIIVWNILHYLYAKMAFLWKCGLCAICMTLLYFYSKTCIIVVFHFNWQNNVVKYNGHHSLRDQVSSWKTTMHWNKQLQNKCTLNNNCTAEGVYLPKLIFLAVVLKVWVFVFCLQWELSGQKRYIHIKILVWR